MENKKQKMSALKARTREYLLLDVKEEFTEKR